MNAAPPGLHPYINGVAVKTYVLDFGTRPITALDKNMKRVCVLCTDLPSMENGLVRLEDAADGQHGMAVTIKLKPDLFWGDGVPVTAKDLAFTWRVGSSAKVGFTNPCFWTRVTGVDVVDDHTAVMHVKERINSYDQWGARLLPEHVEGPIWAKLADASAYRNVTTYNRAPTTSGLYNGPYLITGYQSGQQIVLEPNPHWSGKRPGFKRIVIKIIEDTAALQANVLAGDVDLAAADAGHWTLPKSSPCKSRSPTDSNTYSSQPPSMGWSCRIKSILH